MTNFVPFPATRPFSVHVCLLSWSMCCVLLVLLQVKNENKKETVNYVKWKRKIFSHTRRRPLIMLTDAQQYMVRQHVTFHSGFP